MVRRGMFRRGQLRNSEGRKLDVHRHHPHHHHPGAASAVPAQAGLLGPRLATHLVHIESLFDAGNPRRRPVRGIIALGVSQQNVEIVRRGTNAFNRGDLETLIALYAPEAELIDRANAPDQPSIVRGREAIRRTAGQWLEPFEEFRCDVDEYVDAGDAVICSARWHGRGKRSGAAIDLHQYDAYELIDGKVVRATMGCRTKDEALRATGIEDPDVR